MNSIGPDTVRRIAKLARLRIEDEERLVPELSAILKLVDQLRGLPLEGVEPMTTPAAGRTPLRTDDVAPDAQPETILANAPDAQDGFFRVPKVIEGE